MKRQITLILALILVISLCACSSSKETADTAPAEATTQSVAPTGGEDVNVVQEKAGVLTMLNITEEEAKALFDAKDLAITQMGRDLQEKGLSDNADRKPYKVENQIIFYDTLDAMLMGLKAGDIDKMSVFQSTAQYLCAHDDELVTAKDFEGIEEEKNKFTEMVYGGILTNNFAFMMKEGNEVLRDEFNEAMAALKDDGTLDKLIEEQIDGAVAGKEIKPVEMPAIDGAETVKVAVTGSLPPMDFIAADGTPAGFNTAVLAEISKRINKNIELVGLDSAARATALASGQVDAVFWTRTSDWSNERAETNDEDIQKMRQEIKPELTDEQVKTLEDISSIMDINSFGTVDMPEGTIITDSYFSDNIRSVRTKEGMEAFHEAINK